MIKKLRGLWTPRHKTDWDIGTFMATERDIVQAIYWYQESAKGGCEAGMLHLAEYYKNRKQYKEAAKWYRQYVEARIKWRNKRRG